MSYEVGMNCIRLKPTSRLAHTEYCSNDALRRRVRDDQLAAGVMAPKSLEEVWECDLAWCTNEGPVGWGQRGRVTDMGHCDFLEGGVDRRQPKTCPFKDVQEVWAFDAVKEYGAMEMGELAAYYQKWHRDAQAGCPNQVLTAGYYNTMVSGAIQAFGWDMLLEAAADQDKFELVLDSFFRLTMHHVQAWAKTDAPVFIQHDDMVWSAGPFMHPDFYRRVIFPRYQALWRVLHEAGKRVLYCSDGDFTMFIDDIVMAGADGLIFEPMTSLDAIVERYGKTHVIVGSKVDCRTLTFGTKEQIAAEVDATLKLAMDCPGFMFAVGNHIPSNVPVENALFYMDYLRQRWCR